MRPCHTLPDTLPISSPLGKWLLARLTATAAGVFNKAKTIKLKIKMKAEIKTIHPQQAQQLLKLNTRNRPLAKRHVNLLADEINHFIEKNQNHNTKQLHKQWLVWFDAFKTLKFIHAIRDINQPNLPWAEILENKPF